VRFFENLFFDLGWALGLHHKGSHVRLSRLNVENLGKWKTEVIYQWASRCVFVLHVRVKVVVGT
jgi:hypothetical protein